MTRSPGPEPALSAGEDPLRYAQILSAVYDATMAGGKSPARPREVVGASWRRLRGLGIDPEQPRFAVEHMDIAELEFRRRESGLSEILGDLAHGLESVVRDGENILVVADHHGRVLWRSGSASVLDRANALGFSEGASWAEDAVGTNAIGTALVSRRAVQIFSAEHYVRSHHPWTCAGAPIKDPRTGHVVGAVDVSGPARTVHPTTLALVDTVARLAESRLREAHRQQLDRLRSIAAPMLARLQSPALAVDSDGWVAAVESVALRDRVLLPDDLAIGRCWLPELGVCDFEPLPGGWLVRPCGSRPGESAPAPGWSRPSASICVSPNTLESIYAAKSASGHTSPHPATPRSSTCSPCIERAAARPNWLSICSGPEDAPSPPGPRCRVSESTSRESCWHSLTASTKEPASNFCFPPTSRISCHTPPRLRSCGHGAESRPPPNRK